MMEPTAVSPFTFIGCSELQESLGQQADDEKELAEMLEEVPLDSVHFHTHSYFLRHRFIERVYPNDFAQWVVTQVGDHILGEKLAVVDPFDYPNMEDLREEIISIIDDHLSRTPIVPRVVFGRPFYFHRSRILEVPTGVEARTLGEFRRAVSEIDVSAIYFHMFEAHFRLHREESDFSAWIRTGLGLPDLADRIRAINPYLGSLERLRSSLLTACDGYVARG
ncbi:hypothetical protein DNFV4_04213 [Nitrospira tepida]|uniref:Uncharacterized protein n=1 Tax=Nitrospira tepida TaxID=2973512 RepID=A0AA86N3C2_9BACT|nr:DUF5752 family protein [Nitrospira tepida]CAI4033771.1 hypothetical protein DNFV4_04213 [Nitrospira tepida]